MLINLTYSTATELNKKDAQLLHHITSLKDQANNCEFDQKELKNELIKTIVIIEINDDAVREKLLQRELKNELIKTIVIIEINDDAVREKLLQRESDTLEKAIECCILTEAARQQLET
ncbi:hypothetical protein QE152_g14028 [Popillia japonica]|uniref:Uncharacterized protein n=1 Tax=Popillia japonica TaxID=7064 RepID=A0AAW1L7U1_POPJA